MRERQRPQQHRLHQAEDRTIRPNHERERRNRGHREYGLTPQPSKRESEILPQNLQPAKHVQVACIFHRAPIVAELPPGARSRFRDRHAFGMEFRRTHLDVIGHFVIQVLLEMAIEEGAKLQA